MRTSHVIERAGAAAVAAALATTTLASSHASADVPNVRITQGNQCLHAWNDHGADVSVAYPEWCDGSNHIWEFTPTGRSAEGRKLYHVTYPKASPDLCLSVQGREGGEDTKKGDGLQLESCADRNDSDALWWYHSNANGERHLHNYQPYHRDLAITNNPADADVELWTATDRPRRTLWNVSGV